jgi:predicted transcriptional regulator of viral defense system
LLPADAAVARLAAAQNRVVSTEQLRDAGQTRNAISHRVRHGGLQRMWHGVYLVGPGRPDVRAYARAALLTVGRNGVISGRWAAYLWGLVDRPELPVDVTITTGSHRGRREVLVHRTVLTDPRDFTTKLGFPVTSPARTLLDLAPSLGTYDFEAAVAEAQVRKLVTERAIREILDRCGRHKGAAKLHRTITAGPELTRAESERILRRICSVAGLAQPRTNAKPDGEREVDAYWPPDVIAEVDGFSTHGHRKAFAGDRRKRSILAAKGYRVLQFTASQLTQEPLFVAATIGAALGSAQSSSSTAGELARRASASMPVAGSGREK